MDITLLLGAPGSGKGTVASRLATRCGYIVVSSGDLLRDAVAKKTPDGLAAQVYMNKGELVPDAIVGHMIGTLLKAGAFGAHYVLDGFPRTVKQLEMLAQVLSECGGTIRRAVLIEVSDELVVERIAGRRVCPQCNAVYHAKTLRPKADGICDLCGTALVQRTDDSVATVLQRLEVYRRQTGAVIEACAARGMLSRIDGTGDAEMVVKRVLQALK